jgi:hypothetical protein
MPVGQFSVQGIIEGFSSTWPALQSLVSDLGDDLIGQAADIADQAQGAIGDAFGAIATIDRQKLSNMSAVAALDLTHQVSATAMLNDAEAQAQAMNDPQQAAAYFKMRSAQILELGKLQDQISVTGDRNARARLLAQLDLVTAAQKAEISAFGARSAGQTSPAQDLAAMLQKLLTNSAMPGILENPVINQLAGLLDQLRGTITPAASIPQLTSGSGPINYNQNTSYTMPIYTNQSPEALQQSFAVMNAGMI